VVKMIPGRGESDSCMLGTSKILTVSYGTFSCTLEGFEEPFATMRSIAEYFRDLAAGDRYFGAEPPSPDAAMLQQIAEREIHRRVDTHIDEAGVTLRAHEAATPTLAASTVSAKTAPPRITHNGAAKTGTRSAPLPHKEAAADTMRAAGGKADVSPPSQTGHTWPDALHVTQPDAESNSGADIDSVTEKLERIRRVVARGSFAAAAPAAPAQSAGDLGTLIEGSGFEEEDADLTPLPQLPERAAPDSATAPAPELAATETDIGGGVHADSTAPAAAGNEAEATIEPEPAGKAKAGRRTETAAEADGGAVAAPRGETGTDSSAKVAPVPSREPKAPFVLANPLADEIATGADEAATREADRSAEPPAATPAPVAADEADEAVPGKSVTDGPEADGPKSYGVDTPDVSATQTDSEAAPEADRATGAETASEKSPQDVTTQDEPAQGEVSADEERLSQKTREAARRARDRIRQVSGRPESAESAAGTTPESAAPAAVAATAAQGSTRGQRRREMAPELDDVALGRLLAKANLEIDVESARERRSNITHLKAAVVATKAARQLGDTDDEDDSMIAGRFHDDLAQVVRPSSASGGRAGSKLGTPLVLVSEQRIDRPAPARRPTIRPRRITKGNLALEEYDDETREEDTADEATKENAAPAGGAGGFARFAQAKGAHELPDLLEAAAAYLAHVEGKSPFSRPQLMRKVVGLGDGDNTFTREAGLRSFGLLLRQGRLRKVASGKFSLAESSRFLPESEADGEKGDAS